jgi:predicted aspartyl protease
MRVLLLVLPVLTLLVGCVSKADLQAAVSQVDAVYEVENDKTLGALGERGLPGISRQEAFEIALTSVRRLGLFVEQQNIDVGFIYASAAAPAPLTRPEWEHVVEIETPRMHSIAEKQLGPIGWFARLNPDGKDILINVLLTNEPNGEKVAIAIRLRNRVSPPGIEQGTQPPPAAVTMALEKFWTAFDQELASTKASRSASPATVGSPLAVASNPSQGSLDPNATRVPMSAHGGTYLVPVLINGAITLDFVVDSGSADVSVPADVVLTLMRTGTLNATDFTGKRTYVLADGTKVPSDTFTIKSLKAGDRLIENVSGSVAPPQGSLLLGQSFLQRLKTWSVDNKTHELVLN